MDIESDVTLSKMPNARAASPSFSVLSGVKITLGDRDRVTPGS